MSPLFLTTATNGAQNNIIQNNTITLGSTYQNAIGVFSSSSSSSTNTTLAASSTAGTNSNNKFYSNTISGVAYGMYFICEPITATINQSGIDIGGTSAASANTITFGNAVLSDIGMTRFSGTNPAGIFFRNGAGDSVRFNSITSNSLAYSATQSGGVAGIVMVGGGITPSGVTYASTISNNSTINLTNTGTTAITGIDFGGGISTGTITGSNNSVTLNQTSSAANSAAVTGIKASYASSTNTASSNTVVINQSSSAGTLSAAATGVTLAGTASTTITTNTNTITLKSTGSGTGTITGSQTALNVAGISTINTANTNTILFNQTTSVATGITTGTITGIVATSAASTSLNIRFENQITVKQAVTRSGSYGSNAVSYLRLILRTITSTSLVTRSIPLVQQSGARAV